MWLYNAINKSYSILERRTTCSDKLSLQNKLSPLFTGTRPVIYLYNGDIKRSRWCILHLQHDCRKTPPRWHKTPPWEAGVINSFAIIFISMNFRDGWKVHFIWINIFISIWYKIIYFQIYRVCCEEKDSLNIFVNYF